MLGDSVRRRQPRRRAGPPGPASGSSRRGWRPLLVALPFALVVPFLLGYLLAVLLIFPTTEPGGGGIAVPDLVGQSATEAQRSLAAAGLGPMEVTQLPHPGAAAGQVIAQSPLPGQQARPGASVAVALSSGRERAMVPDVIGFSAERAETLLRRAGFDVERVAQESPATAGQVIRTDPEPAQERVLPARVTLVVSSGPPAVPEPDTLFDAGR